MDYRQKPISLDVKEAEIGTVLRSLAGYSGTNIVASPNVEGKVTVKLEEVPWEEALGVILRAHSFDYVEEQGIYRIDTAEELRQEKLAIERSRKQVEDLARWVVDELGGLEAALKPLPDLLAPEGRAGVIAFHSLEDRIVKNAFRDDPRYEVLTRKPVRPCAEEIERNPRSHSSRLRVAQSNIPLSGDLQTRTPTP